MKYEGLEEAIQKIDLLDYASRSYSFKRSGYGTYKCHCPLHHDPNPSMTITPDKNLFHCFSCGVGGTIYNWLRSVECLSPKEAIEKIADLSGVGIRECETSSALELYKQMNQSSPGFSQNNSERTILPETELNRFRDELPEEWIQEGISPEVMRKYQIRIDDKSNRIVYPVWDASGNLIGMKGRTRFKDYQAMKISKYMNYTRIGCVDFFIGLKENRAEIENLGTVIIFEGIKSGMKVEGWGYSNWLAAETSTLNENQIKLLLQMKVRDVTIAFDKDVSLQKIRQCTGKLRWFTNVFAVIDKWGYLDEKDSPCDKGREVWETLLQRRIKV